MVVLPTTPSVPSRVCRKQRCVCVWVCGCVCVCGGGVPLAVKVSQPRLWSLEVALIKVVLSLLYESLESANVSTNEVACYRTERALMGCREFRYGIHGSPSVSSS